MGRKKRLGWITVLAISGLGLGGWIGCTSVSSPASTYKQLEESLRALREKVGPAVVNINVVKEFFSAGKKQKFQALGSGALISPDGLIVTNYHVAGDAARIIVMLMNGEKMEAHVVGEDPWVDLALIQLDPKAVQGRVFPYLTWGDSDQVYTGQMVAAHGSPWGFSKTMTVGFVSFPRRVLSPDFESNPDFGLAENPFTVWIHHSAPIYGGNSGGPLTDMEGQIIGINARGGAGSLAITSNLAQEVVHRFLKWGEPRWSWVGWSLSDLDFDKQKFYGLSKAIGVIIDDVVPTSPADRAGIKAGDILMELNHQAVKAEVKEEVPPVNYLVAKLPLGATVPVRLWRNGTVIETQVKTEALDDAEVSTFMEWPGFQRKKNFIDEKKLGFIAEKIVTAVAVKKRLLKPYGVYVVSTVPGSLASDAKMEEEDIIKEVTWGGQTYPITGLKDFREVDEKILKETPEIIYWEVLRGNAEKVLVMKDITWDKNTGENPSQPK